MVTNLIGDHSKPLLCIIYSRIQYNIYKQRASDPGKYKPFKPSRRVASLYVVYVHIAPNSRFKISEISQPGANPRLAMNWGSASTRSI